MAARKYTSDARSGGVGVALERFVIVVLFTGVETAGLGIWLALVLEAPTGSVATALGLGVLGVALVVEHLLTDVAVNGIDVPVGLGSVLAISASETALWALWLVIAEQVGGLVGVGVAGVVLAAVLVPQHTIEDNVLRGESPVGRLLDSRTLGFSVVEALGATAWLAIVLGEGVLEELVSAVAAAGVDPTGIGVASGTVGLAALAIALFVEHAIGVGFSRRDRAIRD